MDPNEQALAYDTAIQRQLDLSRALQQLRAKVLDRCLKYDRKELS
jgi:hypothetical protein